MLRKAKSWRRELVKNLALRTPFGEWYSKKGPDPYFARALGVNEKTLREAALLWRKTEDSLEKTGIKVRPKVVVLSFYGHVHEQIDDVSKKVNMESGAFVRSFLHAAMQTDREPTIRPDLDRRRAKYAQLAKGPRLTWRDRKEFRIHCNVGLVHALDARARTCGVTMHLYVLAWLMDLFDRKLTDMTFAPVDAAQTFTEAERYRLPMPSPEELEATSEAMRAVKLAKRRAVVAERCATRANKRPELYMEADVKRAAERKLKPKPKKFSDDAEDVQDEELEDADDEVEVLDDDEQDEG